VGERSSEVFDSTWLGVVEDSAYFGWRVVGWTGEPPNYPGNSNVHFHAFAQFNSMHSNLTYFSFADGSIRLITDDIAQPVFKAMGTIKGREVFDEDL